MSTFNLALYIYFLYYFLYTYGVLLLKLNPPLLFTIIILFYNIIYFIPKDNLKVIPHNKKGYYYQGIFKFSEIKNKQWAEFPGISKKIAEELIKSKNKIKSFDDLKNIKGIGPKKVENLKKYISFDR